MRALEVDLVWVDLVGDLLRKIPLLAAQHHRTLQALVAGVEHVLRKSGEGQLDIISFNQDVLVKEPCAWAVISTLNSGSSIAGPRM